MQKTSMLQHWEFFVICQVSNIHNIWITLLILIMLRWGFKKSNIIQQKLNKNKKQIIAKSEHGKNFNFNQRQSPTLAKNVWNVHYLQYYLSVKRRLIKKPEIYKSLNTVNYTLDIDRIKQFVSETLPNTMELRVWWNQKTTARKHRLLRLFTILFYGYM